MAETHEPEQHVYDGIQEYDNPLPGWWKLVFWGTFFFSCGYFLHYGLGHGASVADEYALAITGDVSLAETARAAELFLADGVNVTGAASGEEASPDEVRDTARAVRLPVLVGSGLSAQNLPRFADAHGFIVGSSLKQGGVWSNPLDRAAVESMARAFEMLGK